MTAIVPIVIFLVTMGLWIAMVERSHKLLNLFRDKCPKEAGERIPFAFSSCRHPEKLLFFLRKDSVPLLKRDPTIWRLRQQVRLLLCLSVLLPPLLFLLLFFMAVQLRVFGD
jgi:hypothetical protein